MDGDPTTTLTRLLMPACDRVTGPPQILGQIHFHLGCGLVRHRVQVRIQLRQQAESVAFDDPSDFGACLMVREAFFRRQKPSKGRQVGKLNSLCCPSFLAVIKASFIPGLDTSLISNKRV